MKNQNVQNETGNHIKQKMNIFWQQQSLNEKMWKRLMQNINSVACFFFGFVHWVGCYYFLFVVEHRQKEKLTIDKSA